MSKEKNTQQMSLWEGSHVNPSASQENKKVQTMTAISGQKCLDSLGRSNPNSLLGRMCKELLTSKTAWYSDRCKTSWKVKVSKSNVSLFQLQASVLGTKDTESGLWATPNTMDYLPPRSAAGTKKIMEGHRKGRTKPSNLREQVDPETMRMYPTPSAQEAGEKIVETLTSKDGSPLKPNERAYNPKTGKHVQMTLNRAVKMYPTPTQDSASERTKKYKQGGKPLTVAVQEEEKRMYPTPRSSGQENPETLIKRKGMKAAAQHNLTAAVKMYPTPTVGCEEGGEQSNRVERTKSGGFILRKKNKPESTFGAKLSDAMLYLEKMYPTPSTRDYKGGSGTIKEKDGKYYRQSNKTGTKYGVRLDALMEYKERNEMLPTPTTSEHKYRLKGDTQASKCLEAQARRHGGKLNPTFVEFLMGFPMNWTKTEPTELKPLETQSSHKSQGSSDSQSKKFYPTPRANEPGRTTKGYGRGLAELMEGKEQVEPKK